MAGVKVCGLCHPADAALAAELGAEWVGVVLASGHARSQSVPAAAEILRAAGARPGRVGVFVDAGLEEVIAAATALRLDVVQLHGSEAPSLARQIVAAGPWQVWKALRPRSAVDFSDGCARYDGAVDALLLDGWSAAAPGGTGARFDWADIAAARGHPGCALPLVVAGGLNPGNVAEAISLLDPAIVDVSSGVERTGVQRKEPELVRTFVEAVRRASA
jgi:phosphoribosylanthranilate isomerase